MYIMDTALYCILYMIISEVMIEFIGMIFCATISEVSIMMNRWLPEDIDDDFMAQNGINELCGANIRRDLQCSVLQLSSTDKGSLEDFKTV